MRIFLYYFYFTIYYFNVLYCKIKVEMLGVLLNGMV